MGGVLHLVIDGHFALIRDGLRSSSSSSSSSSSHVIYIYIYASNTEWMAPVLPIDLYIPPPSAPTTTRPTNLPGK